MEFTDYLDPANFDPSTPPSTDFYRHANGGWLDNNPVPAEYPAWGAMLQVHKRNEEILHGIIEDAAENPGQDGTPTQMVGDYHAAGMDEEAIAAAGTGPLQPLLAQIDGVEDLASLRAVLTSLHSQGVRGLHSFAVSPDFDDPSRYLVAMGQGGLGLPDRDYYLRDDERSVAIVEAYVAHVAAQLGNLGVGGETEAKEILALETRLAEASLPSDELRKFEVRLNRHTVESLDDLMPRFGLESYVRQLGVTSDSINVDNAGFFTALDSTLLETPFEVIRTYLRWHVVRTFAGALPTEFEDEAFDFYGRKLGGQQEQRDRWTRILAAATSDIGEQVARLFVEAAFSPLAKQRCEELVDGLIESMGRSIRELAWMTDNTREDALEKLAGFTYKIGYPDEWRDYSGLSIGRSSFLENRMECARFEFDRQMSRLEEPVDTAEWAMPAHIVNAYYHPMLNEIVFPAGILQPPLFYPDADDAVNYGGIGTVIGHEITHGFDDNGSQFDAEGRRRNWWSEEDRSEFESRAEGLVAQFSDFEVAEGQQVNGKLTLGENIADLGGLKIAFDAFLRTLGEEDTEELGGLSPRERFFLSYATVWRMNYTEPYLRMLANVDVHSPNPFRVNGPLSNFPPFAETFGVDGTSPMARPPANIVEIW